MASERAKALLEQIFDDIFGCNHQHTSRAFYDSTTNKDYVVCLTCGKRFDSPIQFRKEPTKQ